MKKVRCIKHGVPKHSNYINTDFNLKWIILVNGNKQERMIIKEHFEGLVVDKSNACSTYFKQLLFINLYYSLTALVLKTDTL